MISMKKALRRIKGNLPRFLPEGLLDRLAQDGGRPGRDRLLNPPTTATLFFRQVLHGNVWVSELRRLARLDFTDSAYCQARGRLPVGFFRRLSRCVLGQARDASRSCRRGLWLRRHRVFLVDGSSFSMPDTPELRDTFGYAPGQKEGCGFPVAHLLVRTDLRHGYLLDAVAAPGHPHDLAGVAATDSGLGAGDVVVADRGFSSFAHLALLRQRGAHAVFRAHQRQIIDFTPGRVHAEPGATSEEARGKPRSRWVRTLGEQDQVVDYLKPKERPAWISAEDYAGLPESVRLREGRFRVRDPKRRVKEVTLVTTLVDAGDYLQEKLVRLYEHRWWVEDHLRSLKEQLRLGVLRCQSVPGVLKEMWVIVAIYNAVRRVMARAADQQGVPPGRISFADALYWLRHAQPGEEVPTLKVVPRRPGRVEPRAKKRRPKQYRLLNRPRDQWKQALTET